jgi:L-lysine exporter family protein LysE/ArgO
MLSYISGFSLGLSLILAIGAQNAFVLKQGLKQQHVFLVCSLCAISDAILIAFGVSGFGAVLNKYPVIEQVARYAGAVFLFAYALKSFYAAYHYNHTLNPAKQVPSNTKKVVLSCLAFTWLNPHVYLDTFFLLGSVSTQFPDSKMVFAIGAMTASFVFFFSLGYGAKLLIPIFQKPLSWKILEILVGILMLIIAMSLVWV